MKRMKFLLCTLICMALLAGSLEAIVIRIGTIVPLRSPWVKELKRLNLEWIKITGGKVRLQIFPGGILGSEEDMVRKIRMGILGGAVFTIRGINIIYPDSYVLSIPFFMKSDGELDYLMEKMAPTFQREIEKKGFKVIAWSQAGWVNFFTKNPVFLPKDIKTHKLAFAPDAPKMEQAWKKAGYHIVPNNLKDLMMGLQSGMVNAFYLPPLLAASGQYFAQATNMCSIKVAPVVGGFLLSKRMWKKVPEEFREKIIEVTKKMAVNLYTETIKLEEEAITEMKKHGLIINDVPPKDISIWKADADKGLKTLIGKAFSKEIYDMAVRHLLEYRKVNDGK